VQHSLAFH